LGANTASARAAAHEREHAILFGLVQAPSRRACLVATVKRLCVLIGASFLAMFGAPAAVAWAANTYSVTTTSDDPAATGSLPWAIDQSNSHAGNGGLT
jgi:hypothetical protein